MKLINNLYLLTKNALLSGTSINSWEKYKDYIKVHPSAIITPHSSVNIFNLPKKTKLLLEIGEMSHIYSHFGLVRSQAKIKIGKRCQIGKVVFNCAKSISVGNDVLMAWDINIIDNDSHPLEWKYRKNDALQCYKDYQNDSSNFIKNKDWSEVEIKSIKIKDKVWVGFNVTILKGVTIGEGAVVAACSVVTKDVPSFSLVAGNPAKIIKRLKR